MEKINAVQMDLSKIEQRVLSTMTAEQITACMNNVPEDHYSNSWVVTQKLTGINMFETYQKSVAQKVNQDRYRVETAHSYLCRISANISKYEIYL